MLLLLMLVFTVFSLAEAQAQYSLQVGAWGDSASKGNMGVQAEIRTKLYGVYQPDMSDAFWVGNNLDNGAFIQFGFEIDPGYYCLRGEFIGGQNSCTAGAEQFGTSDARWFWEYWPNGHGTDYYYGSGLAESAGPNGTWHTYAILPNVANTWDFVLDGQPVDYVSFAWTHSNDSVFVAAEKITSSSVRPGVLGPVEFRNVTYLKEDGWHYVDSLYVLRGCGYALSCPPDIPYGVQLLGPNYIIAGTGESELQPRQLLWEMQPTIPGFPWESTIAGLMLGVTVLAIVRQRKK